MTRRRNEGRRSRDDLWQTDHTTLDQTVNTGVTNWSNELPDCMQTPGASWRHSFELQQHHDALPRNDHMVHFTYCGILSRDAF